MMHKLGLVAVNNTDNLLISAFVGVASVGIYSNYYLLIGSVRQVLDQVFQGITASVGNLGVMGGKEESRKVSVARRVPVTKKLIHRIRTILLSKT